MTVKSLDAAKREGRNNERIVLSLFHSKDMTVKTYDSMPRVWAAYRFWVTVWLIKWFLMPIVAIVLLPCCIILHASLILRCKIVKMHQQSVFHMGRKVLARLCPRVHASITEVRETVRVMGTFFIVRALEVPCRGGDNGISTAQTGRTETMVLLHGTAADSLVMAELFDDLSRKYALLALDLPGFGPLSRRSDIAANPAVQFVNIYGSVIDAFLTLRLGATERVYVFAHSFGAYIAVHFASTYPSRVSRLVLASPAGLMPTLGTRGATYAYFFKQSMTNLTRKWGLVGFWALSLLMHFADASDESHYWMHVLSSSNTWGDEVLAGLISVGWTETYWREPALNRIHQLVVRGLPCLIVHGSQDRIMPPHQGDMLRILFGIPNVRIAGVGHSPLHGVSAKELAGKLINFGAAIGDASAVPHVRREASCASFDWDTCLIGEEKHMYRTPFDHNLAGRAISRLYNTLLMRCNEAQKWGMLVPQTVRDDTTIRLLM
eukprot:6213731-Pleurochrysis_carterae.AAC.2